MAKLKQLELFSPEAELIARGYDALSQFDFKKARQSFQKVLEQSDSYQEARHGLVLCRDWLPIFRKKKRLDRVRACELLWQSICEYDFGAAAYSLALKKALLRMLARDVKYFDIHLFSDSGLCLGQILNQMEEHTRAVQAFEPLLDIYPYEPHLLVHYANVLWQARQNLQAKLNYIKAWMIAPSIVISLPVKDEEFGQLIITEGPYMAPIYEWIRQGMPPLDCPRIQGENLEHMAALKIYDVIISILQMKNHGQYDEMLAAQQQLKSQAPDIYEACRDQGKLDFRSFKTREPANKRTVGIPPDNDDPANS